MFQSSSVKDAAQGTAQVEMIRGAFAQVFNNFAAVELDDVSVFIKERNDY